MIFLKKINWIILLIFTANFAIAGNLADFQTNIIQSADDEIVYPDSINKISQGLIDMELKKNQQNANNNADCSQNVQNKFSINSQINLFDIEQLQQLQNERNKPKIVIPKSEASTFSNSLFYTNEQIEEINEAFDIRNKVD